MGSPLALFLLALLIRALPLPTVLAADRVTFTGMDAYYHIRRIYYALARFPETLGFDPYINYPHGARAIWPGFFDTLSAWLVLPFYAWGGLEAAEEALIWFPPLLGAATVVVVYFLALRCLGYGTALLSGLFLCLLPAHYWYSQVGFLDHHAAFALVSAALLLSAVALIQELSSREPHETPTARIVMLGACLAVNLLVWPGSVLHIAVIEGALIVYLLGQASSARFAAAARALAYSQAIALALLLPATWNPQWERWSAWSPTVLSYFQPWLYASLLVFFVLCLALGRTGRGPRDRPRPIPGLVLGGTLLMTSFLLLPGLREGVVDAWQWFAKDEAFQASVLESKPLFWVEGSFSTQVAVGRLSRFVYFLPFALLFLAWDTRRRSDPASRWLLLVYALVLAATTLVQRRFFNSLSVVYAVIMAWTLCTAYAYLVARTPGRGARLGWGAVLAALTLWMLLPLEASFRRPVSNLARLYEGLPLQVRATPFHAAALRETAGWIRRNTPETEGFLDASQQPAYGLLTLPGVGHLFEYEARRPVVSDNFGDDIGRENYFLTHRYFAATDEAAAQQILADLRVRYVVATAPGKDARRKDPVPMLHRLAYEDGNGLTGHRLVFEASRRGRRPDNRQPTPKVFESVAGARVEGRAPAGQNVFARLELRTNAGRRIVYRQRARADESGRYNLTLPYANDAPSGAISTQERWQIEAGGKTQTLFVPQAQVAAGQTLPGPDFGP